MSTVLKVGELLIILFGITYTVTTLVLLALSLREIISYARGQQPARTRPTELGHHPSVSLVVPAHNEETLIVQNVSAFLGLDYPRLEVVVVDDGSSDQTLARLEEAFALVPLPLLRGKRPLETAPIRAVYISRTQPALRVVHKENGGRSDAVNAGLCVARSELVAVSDADSLIEPDAIRRVIRPFEVYPDTCVGVAGAIRIANGSTIAAGHVQMPRVSASGIAATQTLEYLRGFLAARIAWSRMNGLLIVSGAFGAFRRDLLVALGGLSHGTLGEDMEITMRLHRQLRPSWKNAHVFYTPDAACWTEAPSKLAGLRTQRIRWQVGLLDNLRLHKAMFGRPRFGAAGTVALPYIVLYEALAPLVELSGYVVGIVLLILDPGAWEYVVAFLVVSILLTQVLNATALLIAEIGFHRYSWPDMFRLSAWGLVEALWYRPTMAWWRTRATVSALTGRRPGWGTIPRGEGILERPADAAAPLTR